MGCKKNMIKLLLVVFNVIAVIIGLALLGIGAYSKYEYGEILAISESSFTSIPAMLMILGVLVFILGFLGCFGSFRENRVLLILYTILLILIVMGEIVAIIISMIYKGKIEDSVEDGLEEKIDGYIAYVAGTGGDEDDKDVMDSIQDALSCCGIHGAKSYTNSSVWVDKVGEGMVPTSCCQDVEEKEGTFCDTNTNPAYSEGCYDKTVSTLKDNAGLVIGITIGFILIQIVGVCLGCILCQRIARDGYKEV